MDGGSMGGWGQGREGKRGRWTDNRQRGTNCCVMSKLNKQPNITFLIFFDTMKLRRRMNRLIVGEWDIKQDKWRAGRRVFIKGRKTDKLEEYVK